MASIALQHATQENGGSLTPENRPETSALESLSAAALRYLETGKPPEITDTALGRQTITLSLTPERSFQIHAHLGHGAEGMVFYASLVGEGWGEQAGKDAAIKVSQPFSLVSPTTLPGLEVSSTDDCASLYGAIHAQQGAIETLQERYRGDRKISPELHYAGVVPLPGQRDVGVQVLITEFVEGELLGAEISRYEKGDGDARMVLEHIYQSSLTLRSLLLSGLSYVDANAHNFIVSSSWHSSEPFSVFVDFGGAERDSATDSEDARDQNRSRAVEIFASECRQIRFGPPNELIAQGVDILTNLEEGAISLTKASEQLRALLDREVK